MQVGKVMSCHFTEAHSARCKQKRWQSLPSSTSMLAQGGRSKIRVVAVYSYINAAHALDVTVCGAHNTAVRTGML